MSLVKQNRLEKAWTLTPAAVGSGALVVSIMTLSPIPIAIGVVALVGEYTVW